MGPQRPLHLDVGVPSGSAFGTPADTPGQADARSEQELADQGRNLRDLLSRQRAAAPANAPAPASDAVRPFDLFRSAHAGPDPKAPPPAAAALTPTLEQMASRLLVGDGSQGRRGVQITLADAQLPGVVVDVFEEAGRLVARFTCSDEAARERLCAAARWFAHGLAQRLQRDIRVEVQTDDPEDACLLQVDSDH
ncbi:hypothetical protein [Acidovorax cavernicola]|uniref:Uncharacterized protein n=1 Tax=Acidovorax cavernicola TaxID=1675792 RepID=A0A9X8CYE1_9BURK|nr:hypothetical protein [Acidovorax cavernicola]RIX71855.1 hypothetical protein D3H34_31500 [Acidovorax cavernicola]